MKKCNHCQLDKDEMEFHKDRSTKDGKSRYCKQCVKLQPWDRYESYHCILCNTTQLASNFIRNGSSRISKYCNNCFNIKDLVRYHKKHFENPEALKKYHRNYKREYRKKLRLRKQFSVKFSDGRGKYCKIIISELKKGVSKVKVIWNPLIIDKNELYVIQAEKYILSIKP